MSNAQLYLHASLLTEDINQTEELEEEPTGNTILSFRFLFIMGEMLSD